MQQDNRKGRCTWFSFSREDKTLRLEEHGEGLPTLLGLGSAALRGEDLLRFVPWGEHEKLHMLLESLQAGGEPASAGLKLLRRDGQTTTLHMLLRRESGDRYTVMAEEAKQAEQRVRIRTFGYFDVFVDGQAISFPHAKTKELLALLVDRQGGFVSSSEAVSFLWEEESADKTTLSRYRKVAMRLRDTLAEYGIEDIIEVRSGSRRLMTEKVSCDLLDHLAHRDGGEGFQGYYMTNYSWAETTLAQLMGNREQPLYKW